MFESLWFSCCYINVPESCSCKKDNSFVFKGKWCFSGKEGQLKYLPCQDMTLVLDLEFCLLLFCIEIKSFMLEETEEFEKKHLTLSYQNVSNML